ncbi:hypothetical protein RB653_003819 [Dictyostelium firmibasis]|uniref:AB hydrolase-1 domain-containing protein n=1 Tax=Dictyostelium firmibasis TaxID=79012 RepID=A0AAN7U6D4_9MYCE
MSEFAIIGKNRNKPFKMAYKVFGEGEEKILFVMGALSKGKNWSSSVEYFKRFSKYQICIFDHIGIGESTFSSLSSVYDLASDTLELLDHLKWDKVNVVGISMGASVSYELSIIAPNRIKTLNLTSFCSNIENMIFQSGIQRLLRVQFDSILYNIDEPTLISNLMFSQSYLESKSQINSIGKNRDYVIPLTAKLANDLKLVPFKTKLSHLYSLIFYKIKQPYKTKDMLLKRPFPIVMFFGTQDPFIDWKRVVRTYDRIQPNLIYICKDAGHALYAEDIKSYNHHTEKFFSFLSSSPSLLPLPPTSPSLLPLSLSSKKCFKTEFLKQIPLEFNSKTILNDHYCHLNYQKTPLLETPLFLNSIKNLNNISNNFTNFKSSMFQKVINGLLFTTLKKIK